jgi:hypothetical protein
MTRAEAEDLGWVFGVPSNPGHPEIAIHAAEKRMPGGRWDRQYAPTEERLLIAIDSAEKIDRPEPVSIVHEGIVSSLPPAHPSDAGARFFEATAAAVPIARSESSSDNESPWTVIEEIRRELRNEIAAIRARLDQLEEREAETRRQSNGASTGRDHV